MDKLSAIFPGLGARLQELMALLPAGLANGVQSAASYLQSDAFLVDAAIVGGVLFMDHMYHGPGKSALSRLVKFSRSARTDLMCFALTSTLLMSGIITLLSFGIGQRMREWLLPYVPLDFISRIEIPWLQLLAFFLVLDFLNYWRHRVSHQVRWWWELHKYHHSATDMTVLTAYRLHPADMAVAEFFIAVPAAMAGVPLVDYVFLRLVVLLQGLLQHSMMTWSFGPLGWIFLSPRAHRIHHSMLDEHLDTNYGGIFSIWDRLFGSWYKGERLNEEVGVPDNPYNQRGVLYDFALPLILAVRAIIPRRGRARTD